MNQCLLSEGDLVLVKDYSPDTDGLDDSSHLKEKASLVGTIQEVVGLSDPEVNRHSICLNRDTSIWFTLEEVELVFTI